MAGKGRKQKQGGRRTTSTAALVMAMLLMLTLVLLMLLSLGILSLPSLPDDDSSSFPHPRTLFGGRRAGFGYAVIVTRRIKPDELAEGEFYLFTVPLSYRNEVGKIERRREQWSEILSWEPRAFLYHNFLSKEECEHLVNLAKPHMAKSTVVDSETGESIDSRVRTSSGMFLNRGQDKIIKNIEKKIADYTFIPVEHGEGLQVLHYEAGEKYEPHHDYFQDAFNTKNGGQRIATVLMYLSDVEEGGETIFPEAKGNISSVPWWNELSECGKTGLAVKPKMGDALLFWSMHPDATLDTSSLHGGCPVIKGNKWSSTKWMHVDEYKV